MNYTHIIESQTKSVSLFNSIEFKLYYIIRSR